VDEWRRRRRIDQVTAESLDDKERACEAAGMLSQWEERRAAGLELERALAVLDQDEREAFQLVKEAGYTWLEVAQMLAVPASTVRSRVTRVRKKLAATLGDYPC
jgi:RNA polymerase sigma factor (sigma-70 family)